MLSERGVPRSAWCILAWEPPDLAVVDTLARLTLIARRRLGCTVELCDAPRRVLELLDLAGLRGIVDGDAGAQQLGDFVGLPAQHLAQDEHGALARGQILEGGDERPADRSRAPATAAGSPPSGKARASAPRHRTPGHAAVEAPA